MNLRNMCFASLLVELVLLNGPCFAQTTTPPTTLPSDQLPDGWEQIDQRMVFLTIQLVSTESSIEALEKQLKISGYKQRVQEGTVEQQQRAREIMDRNGGGPVRWDRFYGRNAEDFFYHPTKNHMYITSTVLEQKAVAEDNSKGEGVPSRQGLPVHQRPPQFDYIYRGVEAARQRAEDEANKLKGKVDQLLIRRRQLEAEQNGLWCKITFQAVLGRELSTKPLYRFDLKANENTPEAVQRLEAARAAMGFLRTACRLIEVSADGIDKNPSKSVAQLQKATAEARAEFMGRLMQQDMLLLDVGDTKTTLGKLVVVSKRMSDVAANLKDAFALAADGDAAGDDQRKQILRGFLQTSFRDFALTVLAGDECVLELAREWKLRPDVDAPASEPSIKVEKMATASGTDNPQSEPVVLDGVPQGTVRVVWTNGWTVVHQIKGKRVTLLKRISPDGEPIPNEPPNEPSRNSGSLSKGADGSLILRTEAGFSEVWYPTGDNRYSVMRWGPSDPERKGPPDPKTAIATVIAAVRADEPVPAHSERAQQAWMPDGKYRLEYKGKSDGIKLIVSVSAGYLKRELQNYPKSGKWEPPTTERGDGQFVVDAEGKILVRTELGVEEWTTTDGGKTVTIRRWGEGAVLSDPPTSSASGTKID